MKQKVPKHIESCPDCNAPVMAAFREQKMHIFFIPHYASCPYWLEILREHTMDDGTIHHAHMHGDTVHYTIETSIDPALKVGIKLSETI